MVYQNGESSKNDQTKTKPNNATGPRSGPRLVNPTKSIWTADSTTKAVANAHKQLLGAFYHIPPTFVNERWSFQSQISKLLTLAEIADMYGCSHLVNLPIENYIHQYQFLVSSLCSTKPVDMLGLSLKLKSDWIFKEATIVIVGHDAPTFEQAQKKIDTMGTGMSEFIERKRAEFVEKLHDVDHDLLRLESYSSRQGPAKKMHFIATAFFGMVLKDRLDNDLGSALGAGYAKLYHEMTHGRWYTAHELHSFLATFDLKSFAEGNGESFLDEITSKAAEALGDVLGNSPVWSFKEEAPQLRCIEVSEDELPWKKSTD
ncbi:hypothetical protein W97_01097 [Coniosporium apollinis CBS 100218]|uniref:Uncharacterized protein n=1 Tax=Coniosporium apollinis (strain CBS 100218) TaxID=1168221 RepID=R7YJ97_CONA1|nr:uncharacterized protein W97_01097 [Coniosporium apollinis CBS 100218]EON61879.1 hypothetical protein W97_01097 [Coniosporium apollinis CBS 100218]